ncbi:Otogelin [Actinoplanes sp. SE50]|uniref:DUF6114 domain-containing protein n=1 Tax=unclassified Actinoplanes TaxID=2626549 RepID=UPI00023ED223|nr:MULTISPECIES: DUF6114 domain-containing protein [unclassified Actinoplanes]AEV83892.1 Otogelin [Actinoplanes sp. SE50/110]ATO81964.1 Otogelin [Actinoplanes sp. SE50]SLL99372.1 Otogelin [Actinoplanes sp. SE50/110]
MATDDFWSKFRRWRRARPFWSGLLLLLSGLELLYSSNLSLGNLQIHIGPQGFLSYLLPILMLICGALVMFSPAQRMFYGIVGLLTALYSFIGLNLGGWFIGMLLGIVGGALALSWSPAPHRPATALQGPLDFAGPSQGEPVPAEGTDTRHLEVAGHDDRPHEQPVVSDPSILPGLAPEPEGEDPRGSLPGPRRGLNRKALAIITLPILVGATMLIGSRLPASADDCPAGLPSIKTSASPSKTGGKKTPATIPARPAGKTPTKTATTTTPAPATSTSAAAASNDSNPIVDGIHSVVDGVGNLLGIGGNESPAPSASPSASASKAAEPAATGTTAPGAAPAKTTAPAPARTTSKPAADSDVIPCLGARQENVVADGSVPRSAIKPGVMKVDSLTMYNSTYKGVADVPTANGTIKALQFDMDKAVNKPFSLTIDEPGDAVTTIKSAELTTTGNVHFYTPKMTGNLFGLIPVTFTPEQPPPLTLPILWFTNVTIDLAFVSCNTLTGQPLQITES